MDELLEYERVVSHTCSSEKEFYEFYNSYAREKGFSISKRDRRCKPGSNEVIWRMYCCSRGRFRASKWFEKSQSKREPRALTRCGCPAKLEVRRCENNGIWFVSNFVDGHNHDLAKPEHSHMLRSQRRLSNPQKAEAVELGLGGLRTSQIMDVMEKNHGGPECTGFVMQDLYIFFARHKKKRIEGRDAASVLNYMKVMTEKDPEFFFKYNVDSEGCLKNLIWSDSQSQMDYGAFGDVVIFDSTYRVNRYNLPFVPFIGVNHHRGTVVFACGIILDEVVGSYVWLLEAFLEAIHQKHPISVITDGDLAMSKAIEVVLPNTDHRLCSWHVEQNMVRHLRGKTLQDFRKFIYQPMDVEEFERRWVEFMSKHKINDMWLVRMYELRNKWSAAYTRGRTFLGMQSNQRSESLNSRLHSHLNRRMSLVDLVEHYEFCLLRIRTKEIELDALALGSIPFHDPGANPFEKEVARIFTPKIFVRIRDQIRGIVKWGVSGVAWDEEHRIRYELSSLGEGKQRQVYVSCRVEHSLITDARCRCRMLESQLISCAHIFTVLRNIGAENIPPCCVMHRWTMRAKNAFPPERLVSTHVWTEEMQRFRNLRNKGNLALFKASRSLECSDRVMQFFDELLAEDGYENHSTCDTFVGPLPPHYSGAISESSNDVLNPKKIIVKGAPPSNKRLKRFHEYLRTK